MKQGFRTTVELVACHLLEYPVFPSLMDGYVVTFMDFYVLEFGVRCMILGAVLELPSPHFLGSISTGYRALSLSLSVFIFFH
jgi:hypothetical protein